MQGNPADALLRVRTQGSSFADAGNPGSPRLEESSTSSAACLRSGQIRLHSGRTQAGGGGRLDKPRGKAFRADVCPRTDGGDNGRILSLSWMSAARSLAAM